MFGTILARRVPPLVRGPGIKLTAPRQATLQARRARKYMVAPSPRPATPTNRVVFAARIAQQAESCTVILLRRPPW